MWNFPNEEDTAIYKAGMYSPTSIIGVRLLVHYSTRDTPYIVTKDKIISSNLSVLSQAIDWSSADYDFAINNDYIYFVSPGAQALVQIVLDDNGLSIVDDVFANGNLTQKASLHKGWNVAVITNAKYGIMKLR